MKTTNEGFLRDTLRLIPRHMVKALAAGAVLVAAALPLAVASGAGAATAPTLTHVYLGASPSTAALTFGAGASGTVNFTGTGFAYDGGNVSLATTAPGVTFSNASEIGNTGSASYSSTNAATPGTYSVTLTDDNGTSTALAGVLTVDADPTVTAISIPTVAQGQTTASLTITGSFVTGATATITDVATGAALTNSITYTNATTLTGTITGTNATGGATAASGAYTITVTNTDGGTGSLTGAFTVVSSGITNVSPSEVPNTATTEALTISGAGFEPGAVVSSATTGHGTFSGTVVVSPSSITTNYLGTVTVADLTVTVTNPAAPTGNGAVISLNGALGQGEASTVAPIVTATSIAPNAPIVVGSTGTTPVTLTITGSGFGSGSSVEALTAAGTVDPDVTFSNTVNSAGTTLTSAVTVLSGATAGTDSIEVYNTSTTNISGPSANALTVAGPVITSASPKSLAAGAAVGSVITFTGTGFNSTGTATFATVAAPNTHLTDGTFAVTSPTTATYALTTAAPAAGSYQFVVSETISAGVTVTSSPFAYTIDAAPTITSGLVNKATSAIYVGAGAVAVPVTITGTGFATGVTVGSFKNAYGVADAGVTATVTGVNTLGTVISATITIAANDANLSDGFTVSNLDGGTATVAGFATGALYIAAAPTITAVTPATGVASGTTSFSLTGTNFATGAVVTTTPTNGTCGVTTFVSSTTLTVTCTLGVAETTATSLLVTNTNGGEATSAPVLAAATVVSVTPYTTGESGNGTAGKTVSIHVSGAGFYGQPKVTSTNGIKAVVSADSGTELTVRVTVPAKVGGEHTLTFTEPNGDVFKANFKA
jgi:hypothetical protein